MTLSMRRLPKLSNWARVGVFYFSFFAAGGAVGPFLYLLYRQHGLSASEIGVVIAAAHVMNFVVSPAWGAASDVMERRGGVSLLAVVCLGAGPSILVVQAARGLVPIVASVMLWSFFSGAIISLADAATVRMLGEDRNVYGRVRVWGSVGAVIAALAVGQLGNRAGLEIVFPVYAVMLLISAALALSFPKSRYENKQQFSREAAGLLRYPQITFFFFAVLLMAIGYLIWRSTFALYLDDLGSDPGQIGAFFALSSLVEIPVSAVSSRWLGRLGAWRSLTFALGMFILLWLACSVIVSPQIALLLALLHGLAFSAYQVAGVVYVGENTPPEFAGLAQGVYGSFGRGLGSILGSLIGGALYQPMGGAVYRVSALFGFGSLFCLFLIPLGKRLSRRTRSGQV